MTLTETKILQVLNVSPASRTRICEETGIKWTTAFDALQSLQLKGKVTRFAFKNGRGRPVVIWYLE